MASRTLLLEIGCEEVPAKMLARALAELPGQAAALLAKASLPHGEITAVGTPRRLALVVHDLRDATAEVNEELVGPPVAIAFDADGKPTKAGLAFASKSGVAPEALRRGPATGPGAKKGEFALATKVVPAKPTVELLPALLVQLIGGIAWPKSQRWGWGDATFVRPLQWLCALYGADVVPVSYAGISAGRASRGHRFLSSGDVVLPDATAYVGALRAAFVIVDGAERRQLVEAELARAASETGARLRPDAGLLDEVVNLVEYPVAVAGSFDPAFLEVPAEIIVTAMRTHQRYFALEAADGTLAPGFVTVAGSITRTKALVKGGNERVLAARLSDARFFFTEDRKKPDFMLGWNERLGSVVFQAKLGDQAKTIGHKIARITRATAALAAAVPCDTAAATRAAQLCKADLASGVVGEFPELQGVMGMHYARRAGEGELVATAIAEHYLPKGQGSGLPATVEGALVGLADRLDTLVGCFATGQTPTGSADPYGLRRAAIGVLSILLDRGPGGPGFIAGKGWPLSLSILVKNAADAYGDSLAITAAHQAAVLDFLKTRLRGLLVEEGLAAQDVDAALAVSADEPCDARARSRDLAMVPAAARAVFKRVANSLEDAAAKGVAPAAAVDPALFVAEGNVEWKLHRALETQRPTIEVATRSHSYRDLFQALVAVEPAVTAFFDKGGVMVMDPDERLRGNRLALLTALITPFAQVADFRLLAQPAGGAA